ncbi:MAG: [FeFe] hydrogenase H-cluster radical SAM maturase HydE [Lachnospiraceae bacterium]|nr:[FeFe] hydrogenase H-cluster radical SAM maturase HydE [Lachnospiraceae bacterium]
MDINNNSKDTFNNINNNVLIALIDKLEENNTLSKDEWICLLINRNKEIMDYLFKKAVSVRKKHYGNDIYIRGLLEFTNICKNNCLYCGIRRDNSNAERYRLSKDDILSCCEEGYEMGFRTFVLQGGEDPYFNDDKIMEIISAIKNRFPDTALTLSIGEKSYESYKAYYDAGADRYLLRHETADTEHYNKLHPSSMSLDNRIKCLYNLKEIGYQVGAGFMVGSPYQTVETLYKDMKFLSELKPEMIGIGPFITHKDTPFKDEKSGTLEETLYLLGLIRLILPKVLLPATTALGTISDKGRELGILAGANVVMPNLSPKNVRNKYLLYNNKISTNEEAIEGLNNLKIRVNSIGYNIVTDRGDHKDFIS